MLTYIEVETSSQRATEAKVAELMEHAWALGYEASAGAMRVVPVGDTDDVVYCQTVWTTPRREDKW